MGRNVTGSCGFEANRPSISRLALGLRFGVLPESQSVGADSADNRDQEAALLVAHQLTHKEDGEEDQDEERQKRQDRPFAATEDGESRCYPCEYSCGYRREAHTHQRHRQPQVIEGSLSSTDLTSGGEAHADH